MSEYSEKLKDPRWQKKRLQILERDEWVCQFCFDSESTLHVHHIAYEKGKEPWDINDSLLTTLCEECHRLEYEYRKSEIASLDRELGRCGFSLYDVSNLMIGFSHAYKHGLPNGFGDAISWAIQDRDTLEIIIDRYFERVMGDLSSARSSQK